MSQSPKTAFLNLKQESTQQEAFKHVETLRQDFFELEKALRYHDSVNFAIQLGAIAYTIQSMSTQFGMDMKTIQDEIVRIKKEQRHIDSN